MKKDKNRDIMNDKKLNEVNFETITDEELELISGGMNAELKAACKEQLGEGHFLCNA